MGTVVSFFCGCCSHFTPKHDRQPLSIRQNRSCTDKVCILLYALSWVAILYILIYAIQNGGDPERLIRPIDMNGNECGSSPAVEDAPYGALPNPLLDFFTFVCVADCNQTDVGTNPYMALSYPSTEFLHYCIPQPFNLNGTFESQIQNLEGIDSNTAIITRSIGDLYTTYTLIIICCFIALGISFFYLFLLRIFAGIVIWLCIILTLAGGFFMSYTFLDAAYEANPNTVSSTRIDTYKYTGWVTLAVSIVMLILIVALRKQIQIAIEVVKEAAHALSDMKVIIFFPIGPSLVGLLYLVFWIYTAMCIFSVYTTLEVPSDPTVLYHINGPLFSQRNENPSNTTLLTFNTEFRPYLIYHIFHGFWTMEVLIYFTYIAIAGAVANWYFTAWNEYQTEKLRGFQPHQLAPFPLMRSVYRSLRYHIGTVVLAAGIIAVIKTIRAMIHYIEKKTKSHLPGELQKCVFCMLRCCLWCVECCLDKINKNALIWTAIWGDPFFVSACSSFSLIWRNLFRVAALHGVEAVLLFIGKITIAFSTMGIGSIILYQTPSYNDNVQSAWVPCIVILIFSFLIASKFFLIFETVIDATFFCFLVDAENADHEKCDMCAHNDLKSLVGKYGAHSVEEAKERGANVEMVPVKKAEGEEHPNPTVAPVPT